MRSPGRGNPAYLATYGSFVSSLRGRSVPLFLSLLFALLLPGTLVASAQAPQDSATEVRRISSKIQCPICEGTSVADSRSAIAQDMRKVIADKLASGESEEEILEYFVDRYGQGVLRDPPTTGFYSAVWWVPVGAMVLGAGAIYGMTRRRIA